MAQTLRFTISDEPPEDWDSVVEKQNGFLVHTTHWAQVFERINIGGGRYIRVYKQNTFVAQMLVWENLLGGTLLIEYLPRSVLNLLTKIPFFMSFSFHLAPLSIVD